MNKHVFPSVGGEVAGIWGQVGAKRGRWRLPTVQQGVHRSRYQELRDRDVLLVIKYRRSTEKGTNIYTINRWDRLDNH